jgi:hypothetical protein
MSREDRTYWLRAVGLWFLLMMAESLHGLWRAELLAPRMGDAAARDVSVFTGSLVILLITLAGIGWIPARSARTLLLIGFTWVVLTIAYELALGRLAFHRSWSEIIADFDVFDGRLFPIGLLFLMFSPLLAARLRGRGPRNAVGPSEV